jgi:hypothetical protein
MSLQKLAQKVILLVTFLSLTTVFPQEGHAGDLISVTGPRQTEVGHIVRINIDGLKGLNDPKIACVPTNDNWEAVQKLNGDPMLLFFPDQEGLYTFIMAGNKDNKTVFSTFQVQVGKPAPKPPGPGPGPDPKPPEPVVNGKYTDQLRSPYLVSPNNASLSKLIAVYKSMAQNSGSLVNYRQMADALASATKAAIGELDLRAVRDKVADILQNDLASRNSQTYDPVATKAIFEELAKSLAPLLEAPK